MTAEYKKVDVLICGSGSAGVFAAAWLARYGVECTIIEKRDARLVMGQADGVQCRTVEIFESFNMSEELLREAYHVIEVSFWADSESSGIKRTGRTADTQPGLSHLPHVILNQARINGLMLDAMAKWNNQHVTYSSEVSDVSIDESLVPDPAAYPVKVTTTQHGKPVTYQAKYVLAAEGAHSQVRRSLGFKMIGDSTDATWGVIDLYPRTNFPDIRKKATIHTKNGSLLIIPREGGSLCRFYIELPEGTNPKEVKQEQLIETAQAIFQPYTLEVADVHWFSCYSIGQRLIDHMHSHQRIFMTGDTAHTHSPKAGQGMNASLQDGYNIGWKLAMILKGRAKPDLIDTYASERGLTAKQLIDFDRYFSKLFKKKKDGEDTKDFNDAFIQAGRYTAGLTATYESSSIINTQDSKQDLATKLKIGMRFPSTQVVRVCDVKAMHLVKACPSDGRFRLVVFGGNLQDDASLNRLQQFASFLDSEQGPIRRFTPKDQDFDSFIEIIVVLSGDRLAISHEQLPDCFWPTTGKYKMRDLHKIFIDDQANDLTHGHAYDSYGVGVAGGAVAIVRPDQYVSMVLSLDDHQQISKFFEGWAIPA